MSGVTFTKKSFKQETAKYNKPTLQYDVFIDVFMLPTCQFLALLLLTPELPELFLVVLAADYAAVFPSGC